MSSVGPDVIVVPSLLDRLEDQDSATRNPDLRERIARYRKSVLRDLEELLNTRNTFADLPSAYVEARHSVLTYGLPEFTSFNIAADNGMALGLAMQRVITFFEPRLVDVKIDVEASETDPNDRDKRKMRSIVRIHVDARLRLDPYLEPIRFDINVPISTYSCDIRDLG